MHAELLGCGQTDEGQLGVRLSEPNIRVPDRIIGAPNDADGSAVRAVACGENHTIFLTNDGKMWSVGSNVDGQLGRGKRSEGSFSIYPVSLTSGVEIIQVSAGRAHSIALACDGRVFAWGCNDHGQLGMESSVTWQESPKRVKELTEVVQVAAGADHGIALTEAGRVYVWGEQADGRCFHTPLLVEQLSGVPIVRVLAGARHCVAISASGAVFTWGQNNSGELGMDDLRPRTSVYHVDQVDGLGVVEAACGDNHTVLLTHTGRTFSFGSDTFGQCGFGKKIEKRTNPTAISDLIGSYVTRIAAGACHTIAVIKGSVYPFGLNASGQLGNGKFSTQSTPRKTDELDHVTSVFAGYHQTFFIRSTSTIEQTEIVGPSCPLKYPMKLDKKTFEKSLESGDKLEVIGLLESVFSSLSSINNSFLFEDERRFNVGSERSHGVDLDQVMETFIMIGESTAKKQYEDLIMDTFLMALESWDAKVATYESLRIFLILPWLSVFTENVTVEISRRIHKPFFDAMCSLNRKLGVVLESWWCHLSTRHFRRIVLVLKAAVKATFLEGGSPIECEKFLYVMQQLFKTNKTHHIIPLETFYIEEMSADERSLMKVMAAYTEMVSPFGQRLSREHYWCSYPFLLNGIAKGAVLDADAAVRRALAARTIQASDLLRGFHYVATQIEVHRETIVEDTMREISRLSELECRKPLKIKIVGEEADDAGGVIKEFFLIVTRKILQPDYGMFIEDEESHLVWFSGLPAEFCDRNQFQQFGRLAGLAIYNKVIVPFPFPLAFYKMLLDIPPTLEDLCELSPSEGNGLQSLLDYDGDDVEEVFGLNFCITFSLFGEAKSVEMMNDGENTPVTKQNREQYVRLYVHHRLELGLNGEIREQAKRFKEGFMDSLPSQILTYFQPRELMESIAGNENYDWSLFRELMVYKEPYTSSHPAIQAFWKAFFALDEDEKKKFLKFLSGSTRLPVTGMSAMKSAIQPSAPESLPVAHTCFNILDLPNISDEQEMLRRLRISIEHTEGFTLV